MTDLQHTDARLAALHPESTMPCPLCAATVKGANLARHLGKVHPGQAVDGTSAKRSWRGPEPTDRASALRRNSAGRVRHVGPG